jgi:hypothetical protein
MTAAVWQSSRPSKHADLDQLGQVALCDLQLLEHLLDVDRRVIYV